LEIGRRKSKKQTVPNGLCEAEVKPRGSEKQLCPLPSVGISGTKLLYGKKMKGKILSLYAEGLLL
jgi:hypothetical protein